MSISHDRFISDGQYATYDPFRPTAARVSVFRTQCGTCGYEPPEPDTPPHKCPKCRERRWERFALPGSILTNAERL
jgi:hypothetical protein